MTELLKDLIPIPEHVHKGDFVLKLTDGVTEARAEATLANYVAPPQLVDCFDQALRLIKSSLEPPPTSKAVYLHGSFGSGKSHFMAVLNLLLRGHPAARRHEKLQPLVVKHDSWLSGKKFLLVPYHLIDAHSVESAVLGGYVEHVRKLHPKAPLPAVYRADGLLDDAKALRARMDDQAFFNALNAVREGGDEDEGWGDMAVNWDAPRFEEALAAPPRSELRAELVSDLIDAYFTSYRGLATGEHEKLVDLDEGLGALSQHAKKLGYDGLVLFLDELVLWLATRMTDHAFVTREGNKVVKLVEASRADRPIPIVSFVARQRDLRELVGEATPGAEHLAFADVLRHAEGRFDVITLEDRNLPAIASERILKPKDEPARQKLAQAFEKSTKIRNEMLDVLLTRDSDRELFRLVYPFSPAFVQTLVAVSSALQRERTALKMLAIYLMEHRDRLELGQLVPVGDLFDLISEGDEPFSQDMRIHFENARRLYAQRLLPMLERRHGLRWSDAQAQPDDPKARALRNDARLLKTLLLSALVPEVETLKDLNAVKLAALNHGTIRSPIRGQEAGLVLRKMRDWAGEVGEIKVSEDPANPSIGLQVSGVDTDAILEKAQIHNNVGNQQRLMKRLIFEQLGLEMTDDFFQRHDLTWKGTTRTFDVVFGNVREIVFERLRSRDGLWKIVIDFPFDEPGFTPRDDRARLNSFREHEDDQLTLVWMPHFLGVEARRDLGKLVVLDHVLAGDRGDQQSEQEVLRGERFTQYTSHLTPGERSTAYLILKNQRTQLRQSLINVLEVAYGIRTEAGRELDQANKVDQHVESLHPAYAPRTPVGASLRSAFRDLLDQALSLQFPGHPDFSAENNPDEPVRKGQVKKVAAELVRVAEEGDHGRAEVPDKKLRPLMRRIGQSLGLGTMHETAFELEHFWRQHVDRCLAQARTRGDDRELTVGRIREWTDLPDPRGLPTWAQDLIVLTVAAQTQRAFYLHGGVCTPSVYELDDAMVLIEERLPTDTVWEAARTRAEAILGRAPSPLKNARNVAEVARHVQEDLEQLREPAGLLLRQLTATAKQLGAPKDAERVGTARIALAFVQDVLAVPERERLARFAEVDLEGRTPQVLGTSLKQAAAVAAGLERIRWSLLAPVFELNDPDAGVIRERLQEAFGRDELVEALLPAVSEAEEKATQLLTRRARAAHPTPPAPTPVQKTATSPPPPAPTPPPPAATWKVVAEDAAGELDAEAAKALFGKLQARLADQPGLRLSVSWRLEEETQ